MTRCIRAIIMIVLVLLSMIPYSLATESIYDILDVDSVEDAAPNSVRSLLGHTKIEDNSDFGECIKNVFKSGLRSLKDIIKDSLHDSLSVFAALMLCAVAASMTEACGKGGKAVVLAGTLAITTISVGDLNTLLGLGKNTIEEMNVFSKALLPVLTAAGTAAGIPTASGLRYIAMSFISDAIISSFSKLMLPLVYAYVALSAANAATGNDALRRLATMIRWLMTTFIKLILTVYTAYMTLCGVISGTADALTLKTVKLTVSGAIPVVGGIISDAADTVITGARIAKNSIGVYGMICILASSVVPFLKIGVQYLLFKAVGVFSGISCQRELSTLVDDIAGGFALILGMVGSASSMLLVSIFLSIAHLGTG